MSEDKKWRPGIPKLESIQLDDIKFIFSQAEKKLADYDETRKSISTKTYALLGYIVTIVLALTGYIYGKYIDHTTCFINLIPLLVTDLYLFSIVLYMNDNIFPSLNFTVGSLPKDLLDDKFFAEEHKGKFTILSYENELANYQRRIDGYEKNNNEKWKIYNNSVRGFLFTPMVFFLALFFVYLVYYTLFG